MTSRTLGSQSQSTPHHPADNVRVHMTGAEWFADVPGGLNRYFTDLYNALRVRTDVAVSAAAFGTPEPGASTWGPVTGSTAQRVWSSVAGDRGLAAGTVIDRHYSLFGRPAVSRRGNHALVAHFHGPWAAESRMAGDSERSARIKFGVERLRLIGADKFVVLSRHSRRLLVEDYRVSEDKIDIISPGVDLDRFPFRPSPNDRPTVLCVRRLERRMGIDVLLRSWPGVVARTPDAELVVVGTGSEETALHALADRLGLSSSVRFEGRASDERLADLYRAATVSVIPSIALEGFGLIALESLAVGCAPIVTDCGGLPDAVESLDPTLIVAAGDADALADRLVRALNGERPGATACRAYAESFSWAASADRHVEAYRQLIR